jgi:hypothetical protein
VQLEHGGGLVGGPAPVNVVEIQAIAAPVLEPIAKARMNLDRIRVRLEDEAAFVLRDLSTNLRRIAAE